MMPASVDGSSQAFEPDSASVRAARRFAIAAPEADGVDLATLELAVSELASNAVLHARTPFVVVVERLDDGVRVSVSDEDPTLPQPRQAGAEDITGRGLAIVRSLARHLEVLPTATGKTVRFELGRSG